MPTLRPSGGLDLLLVADPVGVVRLPINPFLDNFLFAGQSPTEARLHTQSRTTLQEIVGQCTVSAGPSISRTLPASVLRLKGFYKLTCYSSAAIPTDYGIALNQAYDFLNVQFPPADLITRFAFDPKHRVCLSILRG